MVKRDKGFDIWYSKLSNKQQLQVDARIHRIEKYGHFGDVKPVSDGVYELRWKNGWRVYFVKDVTNCIILLLGGHKNDQKKDIKKAKILIS